MGKFFKVLLTLALLAQIFNPSTAQDDEEAPPEGGGGAKFTKCRRVANVEEKKALMAAEDAQPGVLLCLDDELVDHICCPFVMTWTSSQNQCCKTKELSYKMAQMFWIVFSIFMILLIGGICSCVGCFSSAKYCWNRNKVEEEAAE